MLTNEVKTALLFYLFTLNFVKTKKQRLQNKCIRFCLILSNRAHIGLNEFEKFSYFTSIIGWNSVSDQQLLNFLITRVISDIFKQTGRHNMNTKISFLKPQTK